MGSEDKDEVLGCLNILQQMRVKFARIKFVHIDEDFIATELEKNL
jgi:hypothetical protein